MDLPGEIRQELANAEKAGKEGKPGLSRVCARRAAGLAVREFLVNHGFEVISRNNFELMKDPGPRAMLPNAIHHALDNLTMSVDLDHKLPPGIDLIRDAQFVIEELKRKNSL